MVVVLENMFRIGTNMVRATQRDNPYAWLSRDHDNVGAVRLSELFETACHLPCPLLR